MPLLRPGNLHLDAAESVFFQRQLESIDTQIYEVLFPALKARSLIPTQNGVQGWARNYTWRMLEKVGKAEFISDMSDDLPRASAKGEEQSRIIKSIGASFGWDVDEIEAAMKTGTDLEAIEAMAARYSIEQKIDETLALGSSAHGLLGLLNQTGTTSFTPATKNAGGTAWVTATPDEVVKDIAGIGGSIRAALKGAGLPELGKYTVVVPITQYTDIASRRMGDGSDKTILSFCLENIPWIEEITDWNYLDTAGSGGVTRMVCYPKTPLVVAGIVPMEFERLAPQQKGLSIIVNSRAKCGGTVCRYPVSVAYGDSI